MPWPGHALFVLGLAWLAVELVMWQRETWNKPEERDAPWVRRMMMSHDIEKAPKKPEHFEWYSIACILFFFAAVVRP